MDVLSANEGTLYFTCQNGIDRSIFYDEGSYRTICTSPIFGAMADGEGTNTKANLMARYFSFLTNGLEPNIWSATDELYFGIQYVNFPGTMVLDVYNYGYESLNITSINVTGEGFFYGGPASYIVSCGESAGIEVTFTSANAGTFTGILTIESNDPDQSQLLIDLSAECLPPPVIEVSPSELNAVVPPGEIDSEILTIYNNGESDLTFQIYTTETTPEPVINASQQSIERRFSTPNILNTDNSQSLQIYQELMLSLRDSTLLFADDMENGINGWTAEVYGGAPDDLWHQTEINCNSPTHSWWCGIEGSTNYATGNRINTAIISPVIDLTTIDTTVTLQFFENYNTESGWDFCMVDVTIDGGTNWTPLRGGSGTAPSGNSGGWITTILDLTQFVGNEIQIRFYFDTIDGFANDYPGWFFDDVVVYFEGVSWLPIDPSSGTILAGQSANITVTYDATNLDEGEYTANIIIISNDPAEPEVIVSVTLTVGYVNADNEVLSVVTKLQGNYPNPFNPTTTINYTLREDAKVTLEIYNIRGQKVRTLINEKLSVGHHSAVWNGKDNNNKSVSSGIYFYKMCLHPDLSGKADGRYTSTKKMILLK